MARCAGMLYASDVSVVSPTVLVNVKEPSVFEYCMDPLVYTI
jgi:hypothetical protein